MNYLLTYDKPHRKTQDLAFRLFMAEVRFTLVVIPWEERANHKPIYQTKLPPIPYIGPKDLCKNFEDECVIEEVPDGSVVVIGGAGILSDEFTRVNTVINAHCGWLPKVRGLDSLKWAIYYGERIGCSTHIIDETVDQGLLIDRQEVKLDPTDSLFSIAVKQYELELNMLVESVAKLKYQYAKPFSEPSNNSTRRMKHSTEIQMMKRLEQRLIEL